MLKVVPFASYAPASGAVSEDAAFDMPLLRNERPSYVGVSRQTSAKVVMLPTMEGFCFERIKDITFLEAGGNYTTLHFLDKRQVLVCKTLREVELLLPQDHFVRIHRSHSIQMRHLKKYMRGKGGQVLLKNGVSLTVSAGQRDTFLTLLKNYFSHWPT